MFEDSRNRQSIVDDENALLQALRQFFSVHFPVDTTHLTSKKTCWLAFSGGLDSTVLLYLTQQLRVFYSFNVCAIHINHHLSDQAHTWAQFCKKTCADWQIDYREADIFLENSNNIEAQLREKRYAILERYLQAGDLLLTAHHQDDQAETFLLQLFRGAGPKGLAAMPLLKKCGEGSHGRPLLNFSRAELLEFAQENKLSWLDDDSNNDTRFSRNFLRKEVLSLLKTRWPSVSASVTRSAQYCAQTQSLLEEYIAEDLKAVQGKTQNTLSISQLKLFPAEKQLHLLRHFIAQFATLPNSNKLKTIQETLLQARNDKQPMVAWANVEMRRYRDELYLLKKITGDSSQKKWQWNLHEPLVIPGLGILQAQLVRGRGIKLSQAEVSVQFRQGGEMLALAKRRKHALKKLFQELAIPPWERHRIPLLYAAEELVQVVGYFSEKKYLAHQDEEGWQVNFEKLEPEKDPVLLHLKS